MEKICNILINIIQKYTNLAFYKFYINKYHLYTMNDINIFFQDIFDNDYLLEYLFNIKDRIAIDFILINEIENADINDFAINIYKFIKNNMMLLFLINKNINKHNFIIHHASLLKKTVVTYNDSSQKIFSKKDFFKTGSYKDDSYEKDSSKEDLYKKIPNLDQYIISVLSDYLLTSDFIEYILNQDFIKNIQDIHNFINNIDINILKEYINKNCYYDICKDLENYINQSVDDNIYEYIYNNESIINEIINRIQYNVSKILYREFFTQGKYLDKLTQAKDLANINDKRKQQTYIIRTDVNNRDKAFVDIDRHILISKNKEIHKDLFNQYVSENNIRFNSGRRRPSEKDIKSKTDIKCWAYGHISNNVYIIDGTINMSIDEVIQDLNKKGIMEKIYSFEYIDKNKFYGLATREAKLQEVSNNKQDYF